MARFADDDARSPPRTDDNARSPPRTDGGASGGRSRVENGAPGGRFRTDGGAPGDRVRTDGGGGTAVQEFYGRWVRLYDLIARHTPRVDHLRRRAVDALRLDPGDTVLDMGCGTGANLPHLRRAVGPEGRVLGLDVTAAALRVARDRERRRRPIPGPVPTSPRRSGAGPAAADGPPTGDGSGADAGTTDPDARDRTDVAPERPSAGTGGVALLRGDATRPPVEGPVDAVLGTFVVGMFADPASVVEGWCDLAPGGHVVLLDAARSDRPGPVGAAVDAAFDAATVLSTPPTLQVRYDRDLGRDLHRKVEDARTALRARADAVAHEDHLLGLVRLTGGRIPDDGAGAGGPN